MAPRRDPRASRKELARRVEELERALEWVLDQAVYRARLHTEEAVNAAERTAIDLSRAHAESLVDRVSTDVAERLAELRRDVNALGRADAPATTAPPAPATTAPAVSNVGEAYYAALEDRFRGRPDLIRERQVEYLPRIPDLGGDLPVLDLGCGRGEWLQLLAEHGIDGIGVDTNAEFVRVAAEAGLDVAHEDMRQFLRRRAPESARAITMFQVVEHLPFGVLVEVFEECARVLAPGGLLLAETPNARNLMVVANSFWLDPTHQHPLPADLLEFVARRAGFSSTEQMFVNRLGPEVPEGTDPLAAEVAELVHGPGDFTLLAWR